MHQLHGPNSQVLHVFERQVIQNEVCKYTKRSVICYSQAATLRAYTTKNWKPCKAEYASRARKGKVERFLFMILF